MSYTDDKVIFNKHNSVRPWTVDILHPGLGENEG